MKDINIIRKKEKHYKTFEHAIEENIEFWQSSLSKKIKKMTSTAIRIIFFHDKYNVLF